MHPNLRHLHLIFLLIILVRAPRILCEDDVRYVNCSTSAECGNMEISYPFSGGNRPNYCGYPGYELNCDGDAPEFTMMDLSFRILHINYSSNTLTVARADYWDGYCLETYVNTTVDAALFNISSRFPNLTLYYDCPFDSPHAFSCNHRDGNNTIGYYATGSIALSSKVTCENKVTIPIFQSIADTIENGGDSVNQTVGSNLLREALRSGFSLEWIGTDNDLCQGCAESGGSCGSNSTSKEFTCYCRDMAYPSTCPNISTHHSEESCAACVASGGRCHSNETEFTCYCQDIPHPSTCPHNLGSGVKVRMKLLIGISAGVVGILIASAMICGLGRKCLSGGTLTADDQNVEAFIRNYGSLFPKRYTYSQVKKMTSSFACKLGEGGFGCVYKGKISDGRLIAVKVLSKSKGNGQDFINEVASISRTSHVNIVKLIGFCFERSRRALIYEFMPNGSLDKFIYEKGSWNANSNLQWKTLYQIAVGIARGLEYLYRGCNTRILHFDIKPHNILLDEEFCPKISDFGLAKLCERKESMVSMTHARGTAGYIAPEVFCMNFGGVSHKSDVYSYGMLVLEMVGGRKNIDVRVSHTSQIHFPTWIYKRLGPGMDLELESVTNEEEEETARKMLIVSLWCIQPNPSDRPSIDKVVEMLEASLQSLQIPPNPFMFSPQIQ